MQTIPALPADTNDQPVAMLFAAIKSQMGGVPNILRTMGQSPAALEAYLGFSGALSKGQLDAADRERIALAAAGANRCDYCASAHSALGARAGLDTNEIGAALRGQAIDPRANALVQFSRKVVDTRGIVDASDLESLRVHGFDDGAIVEIVANIAANLFTNYFNHIAGTEIDFPVVRTEAAIAA